MAQNIANVLNLEADISICYLLYCPVCLVYLINNVYNTTVVVACKNVIILII